MKLLQTVALLTIALEAVCPLPAETGRDAWLRYVALEDAQANPWRAALPATLYAAPGSPLVDSARDELLRGIRGMLGRTLRLAAAPPTGEDAILVGRYDALHTALPDLPLTAPAVSADGYALKSLAVHGHRYWIVTAPDDRGVLYGAFALLRKMALAPALADEQQSPYANVRWVNQWDNLNGTIERGYGGRSLFWDQGHVREDLTRVGEYGRLLASLGINGCAINNVNADRRILSAEFLPQVARIAEALRPWGVHVVLSVDFSSPKSLGGLDTFDPVDPNVVTWWRDKIDEVYRAVPDLGGIVVKADSEGRVGPSLYRRTHADAANVLANALAPHGGLLFYRGFVYDNHMDWRNPKNDRARAAYDNFVSLDGQFADNAVVQIKHGPIDFQVREPASPLFGTLEKTNQAIELQITQEYMGQGRHTVYLVPMWKDALDFDLHAKGAGTPVKALAAGHTFHRPVGGFIGVANVGLDDNWLGNHLSQANLYGFGRLAWNPDLSAAAINDEWMAQTFGSDPVLLKTLRDIQLTSMRTYEDYTGPLGLQTLTDIVGNHYGVAVEASERNGWGQWHNADAQGVGMDRTVETGTGYAGQYRPPVAAVFNSLARCPDDLLLFFHHVPYTHRLHSGSTVIQYLYDSHYAGAAAVNRYVREWRGLKGHVDDQRYNAVLAQLTYQAGQAEVWRDAVASWFAKESGIADTQGRVGHHPGRFEAESLTLTGYAPHPVVPWESASGGTAALCPTDAHCTATLKYTGPAGWFDIRVRYFDQTEGASHFQLQLGPQVLDSWVADAVLPPNRKPDGTSSMLRIVPGIALKPGDTLEITGVPDGKESAALDYLEILPAGKDPQ